MASGASRWITGPEARADGQRLRARSCAVITGIGTVLADDPRLNVRIEDIGVATVGGELRQPLRVIVDSRLRTPCDAQLLAVPGEVVIASSLGNPDRPRTELEERGAKVAHFGTALDQVDLRALLEYLGGRGCNEIMIEAGPRLSAAWVRDGLVDEFVIYVGSKFLGTATRPLLDFSVDAISDAVEVEIVSIDRIGSDFRICARPSRKQE